MPSPSQRFAAKPAARPAAASDKSFERTLALTAIGVLVLVLAVLGYRAWHRSGEIDRLSDAAFNAFEARTEARLGHLPVGHVLIGPMVECVREGMATEQRRQTGSLAWSPQRIADARLATAKSRCLENFLMRSELYATRSRSARSEMREAILLGLGD